MCEFFFKFSSLREVLDSLPLHLALLQVGDLWLGCEVFWIKQSEADAGETLCRVHR